MRSGQVEWFRCTTWWVWTLLVACSPPSSDDVDVNVSRAMLTTPITCEAITDQTVRCIQCTDNTYCDSGSTCVQGSCQLPKEAATYWAAPESQASTPRIAFDWQGTALDDVVGLADEMWFSAGATYVADGPFNKLNYASGTNDYKAIHTNGDGFTKFSDALCHSGDPGSAYSYTVSAHVIQNGAAPSTGGTPTPQDDSWDRVVHADRLFDLAVQSNTGAVRFGVWNHQQVGFGYVATSSGALRKNEWHRIRANVNADGWVTIYIDERLVSEALAPHRMSRDGGAYNGGCHDLWISDPEAAAGWYGRITGVWAVNGSFAPDAGQARLRVAFDMDGSQSGVQNGYSQYKLLAIDHDKLTDKRVMFYSSPVAPHGPVVDASNPVSDISTKVFDLQAESPSWNSPVMLGFVLKGMTQSTYEAWVYRTAHSGATEYVLYNGNFSAQIDATDKLKCAFADARSAKTPALSTSSIGLDRWVHVACSFDGQTTRAWVDGLNEASVANVAPGGDGYFVHGNGNLYMGITTEASMRGKVTGVKVWDRAVAPDVIRTCASACTYESDPNLACHDTASQETTICGSYGVSTANHCIDVCRQGTYCSVACDATTCGAATDPRTGQPFPCHEPDPLPNGTIKGEAELRGPVRAQHLMAGRLSNLIVTRNLEYPADVPGEISGSDAFGAYKTMTLSGHTARFATSCADWSDGGALNVSDASMFVVVRDAAGNFVKTLYNDDSTLAGGNGKGAYIEHTGVTAGTYRYTVYAYSNLLNTAYCQVRFSTDSLPPSSGQVIAGYQQIGGTLVAVSGVYSGETFEIQTPGVNWFGEAVPTGETQLHTRLVLFNYNHPDTSGGWKAPVIGGTVSAGDHDAKLQVTDGEHLNSDNFLLVGKKWNGATGAPADTVVRVDLHRPQNPPTVLTGNGSSFDPYRIYLPGRYTFAIDAWVDHALGDLGAGDNKIDTDHGDVLRGKLNGPAFMFEVQKGPTAALGTRAAPQRRIALGAFGSQGADRPHRFFIEFEVNDPNGEYFGPVVSAVQPGVHVVFDSYVSQRNAEAATLRIAEANMLYYTLDFDTDMGQVTNHVEYKNIADLLGPRGNIAPGFGFADPGVRGPFQWNSDIVNLTEMGEGSNSYGDQCDGDDDTNEACGMKDAYLDVARSSDSRDWGHIHGRTEEFAATFDGGGAVFAAGSALPGWVEQGMKLTSYPAGSDEGECHVSGQQFDCAMSDDWTFYTYRFLPAAVTARSSLGQPILIVQAHLAADPEHHLDRRDQVASMTAMLAQMVEEQGSVVNRTVSSGGAAPDAPNNRLILTGDMNLYGHSWGEHYELLRTLRETFGYAVDVAMAVDGSYTDTMATGMHDVAGWEDVCLQSPAQWNALPDFVRNGSTLNFSNCFVTQSLRTPWWASSWRGAKGNGMLHTSGGPERFDYIILVGRGWEVDDATLSYRVMQDMNARPNVFAPTGKGVSFALSTVFNGAGNYKPRWDVGNGTAEGSAALSTDHHPIGATLRLWAGHGAR